MPNESLIDAHGRTPDPTDNLDTYSSDIPYQPEPEEQRLVSQLDSRFKEAANHRRSYDEEVLLNYRILQGNLLPARAMDSGDSVYISLTDTSRQEWSKYIATDNVTKNVNRALVGKHTRIVPGVEVIPATDDEEDVESGEIATTAIEAAARVNKLRLRWVEAHRYMGWAGTGIVEVFWNKKRGRKLAKCPECNYTGLSIRAGEECPVCKARNNARAQQETTQAMQQHMGQIDQQMQQGGTIDQRMAQNIPEPIEPEPAPILELVNEGEVWVKSYDPRNFYPEPGVAEVEDMRYCCTAESLPLSEVAAMFPKMGIYLTPESSADTQMPPYYSARTPAYTYDRVTLYTWHFRPTASYPEGRIIYVCNEMVMNKSELDDGSVEYGEPHPYPFLERLPFFPVRWERRDGQFWGESHITSSKWQQFDRNDLLRDMREQRRLTYRPPLLAAIGSLVSQEDFYNYAPGTVIQWNAVGGGGIRPGWLEIPEFPAYTYEELERMRQSCMAAASVTDQEMGVTAGDPSGRYAAILEAQSAESLRAIMISNASEWMELHRSMLLIMQNFYSEDKIWTVRGKGRWFSNNWSGVNLMDGWDIGLVETDSLSKNPALRLEQTSGLLERGYFTDVQTGAPDMDHFGRMAGIQDSRRAPDPEASSRTYARAIPELIMQGQFMGAMPWDPPKVCADELLGWLRGPGRRYPVDVVAAVAEVWQMYMIAYAQQQQQMGMPPDPKTMPAQYQNAQQPPAQSPNGGGSAPGNGGPQSNSVPGPPGQEASQMVKQADAQGERLARGGPHEG